MIPYGNNSGTNEYIKGLVQVNKRNHKLFNQE